MGMGRDAVVGVLNIVMSAAVWGDEHWVLGLGVVIVGDEHWVLVQDAVVRGVEHWVRGGAWSSAAVSTGSCGWVRPSGVVSIGYWCWARSILGWARCRGR